jgi:hypothetical protein
MSANKSPHFASAHQDPRIALHSKDAGMGPPGRAGKNAPPSMERYVRRRSGISAIEVGAFLAFGFWVGSLIRS